MTAAAPSSASAALRTRQPCLGLAGVPLVVAAAVALAVGLGSPERSLLVLGPISTFALPVIAMIAFWWEDWPGTSLRPPLSVVADTALVAVGGVIATFAGQAVVSHADVQGVFDPAAAPRDAPTFPATMPLAGAVFAAMLQLTLVTEGWPLRGLSRFRAGALALASSWAAAAALYEALVPTAVLAGDELGAILVCIAVLQVMFYVVLRGWPFRVIAPRAIRLLVANAVVIAGGWLACRVLLRAAHLTPALIGAAAGSVVAAGLIIGMLFDGWLGSLPGAATVAVLAALLYAGLHALAHAAAWTRAEPEEWAAYAGLNAIGIAVIMHVAIGRRWPFAALTGDPRRGRMRGRRARGGARAW
jgi:hypothetical protein